MQGINFTAIDFETATGKRASICEAGICVVRDGKIQETRSWLVRPQGNYYSYWNIQVHGIRPVDTRDAPEFPKVYGGICYDTGHWNMGKGSLYLLCTAEIKSYLRHSRE